MSLVKRGHAVVSLRAYKSCRQTAFREFSGCQQRQYGCWVPMLTYPVKLIITVSLLYWAKTILSFFLIDVWVAHAENSIKRSCPLLFISDCICYSTSRICSEMLHSDTDTLSTDPYILVFYNLQLYRITYCQVVIFSHLL